MTAIKAGEVILLAGVGLLMIGIAMPLIRRRVGPNTAYGLRTPDTYADKWVWYEANAKSGRDLCLLGCVQFVFGVGLAWVPPGSEKVYILIDAVVFIGGAVVCLIVGSRRAAHLLASRRRAGPRT